MQHGTACQNTVGTSRQTCAYRGGAAVDSSLNTVIFGTWLPDNQTSFIYPSTGKEKSKKPNCENIIYSPQ